MDLTEFIKKEQILQDINLEVLLMERKINELHEEQKELFRDLKNNARMLGIKCQNDRFVIIS